MTTMQELRTRARESRAACYTYGKVVVFYRDREHAFKYWVNGKPSTETAAMDAVIKMGKPRRD